MEKIVKSGALVLLSFSTYTLKTDRRRTPPLCADCGRIQNVPLGQRPSLHLLRKGFSLLVRWFLRYYVVVRLPWAVHGSRKVFPFHCPFLFAFRFEKDPWISRFPRKRCPHMPGSKTPPGLALLLAY